MKINIFIETNNPKIVAELEAMGYERSTFCNDGKYIFLQNNKIFMVNHAPYVNVKALAMLGIRKYKYLNNNK